MAAYLFVFANLANYTMTDYEAGCSVTDGKNYAHWLTDVTSGKSRMNEAHTRQRIHNLSVKLSTSLCSCPG